MLRKGPWDRLVGILRRIARRPQLTFRDRFRHREGVPTEDVEVFVDQRRQPRRILVPNRITFFAQFELEMMLERQLEGIAKAQAAGKYRGRKPIAMETAGRSSSLGGHRYGQGAHCPGTKNRRSHSLPDSGQGP
jgi:hypothetical protein